jgi:CRP/FNR family transcriptional regulator, nitrogen oxide reductase regulator
VARSLVVESQFLEGLEGPDFEAVIAAATTRRLSSHKTIYEQGRPATEVFLLSTGRARYFCITPEGRKTLLHWLVPGDVLGLAALLLRPSPYRVGAETVRESSLLVWNRATIRTLLDRYPRLCQNALSTGATYLDWYSEAHAALVSGTARQRLATVLAHLTNAMGREVSRGVELQVTNEELASAANITSFTASRILSEWQTHRVLTKHRGRIVLHSPRRLFPLTA